MYLPARKRPAYGYGFSSFTTAPSFSSAPAPTYTSAPASGPSMPPMQGPAPAGAPPSGPPRASDQEIAKWNAAGQVGAALASMTGMIATTIISNKGQQKLAEQQARYARQAAPGQAMLAEKQSLLAAAQASLTSAQNAHLWPLALVGLAVVGGVTYVVTSSKKGKKPAPKEEV